MNEVWSIKDKHINDTFGKAWMLGVNTWGEE